MKNIGIMLDSKNDLVVRLGALVIGDVTRQNQRIILQCEKGEIKEAPTLGVGVASFLDDDNPSDLLREIRLNLRADGQVVRSCRFVNDELVIDGGYD